MKDVLRYALTLSALTAVSLVLALSGNAEPVKYRGAVSTGRGVAMFEERVKVNPDDFLSNTLLSQLYVREAREGGGMRSYAKAEHAAREALRAKPSHHPALAMLASILNAQHRFHEALRIAYDLQFTAPPRIVPSAIAAMGDAYLELGIYDKAAKAYSRLSEYGESPEIKARLARIADIHGRSARAAEIFTAAGREEEESSSTPASAAWYYAQAGEARMRTGEIALAKAQFEHAASIDPSHEPAIKGLAMVALNERDTETAIELYRRALQTSAEPVQIHAALEDIFREAGQTELAECHAERVMSALAPFIEGHEHSHSGHAHDHDVRATGHSHDHRDDAIHHVHGRFVSIYLADHDRHLSRALEAARAELEVRRDVHTLDAYAWALFKNGRAEEAAAVMKEAMAPGLRDPLLLFHSGMIAKALGDIPSAKRQLERALTLNRSFSPIGARAAETALRAMREGAKRSNSETA